MAKSIPPRRVPSRGQFLEAAFTAAQRFKASYRGYESAEKAIAALRRRFPGLTKRRYTNAFRKAVGLYEGAVKLVQRNRDILWQRWRALEEESAVFDFGFVARRLRRHAPGFRASTCSQAIGWVWYWHHLR
jgi:hypothetical protein